MESEQAPHCKIVPGAVSWFEEEGVFIILLTLYSKKDHKAFLRKVNKMKKSDMVVSIIEHEQTYSIVFFEDSKKEILTDTEFMLCHMGLQGSYRQFKENHNDDSPVVFTLDKYTPRSAILGSVKPTPIVEPFLIEKLRVIKESELGLEQFINPYGLALPQEHKYRNEI